MKIRLIKLKLHSSVQDFLKINLSVRYAINDSSILEDMFALLRCHGQGIPSAPQLEQILGKIPKLDLNSRSAILKRRSVLVMLAESDLFKYAVAGVRKDKSKSMDVFIILLESFLCQRVAVKKSQCMTCAMFSKCEFGRIYGELVADIKLVYDPAASKLVHPDCPERKDTDFLTSFNNALDEEEELSDQLIGEVAHPSASMSLDEEAEDDELFSFSAYAATTEEMSMLSPIAEERITDGCCLDPLQSTAPTQGHVQLAGDLGLFILRADTVKHISAERLAIFELSQKLEFMLGKEAKGKFAPTNQVAVRKEQAKLEKITDVTKVESSAHALDNDTFDLRLAKKDLIKQQELTPEGKKMLLFVLIDSSMSMMSQFRNAHPSFRARFLTRGVIASAFTLALGERAEKEGGILYMSFFASNVTVPLVCDDAVSFKALRNRVSLNSYNGYGTNISGALSVAFSSIAKAQATDVLTKAEILIITDCEDRIRAQDISPEQKKMLHVLDLSGLAPVSQQAKAIKGRREESVEMRKWFSRNATTYMAVDPTQQLDWSKIISVIK